MVLLLLISALACASAVRGQQHVQYTGYEQDQAVYASYSDNAEAGSNPGYVVAVPYPQVAQQQFVPQEYRGYTPTEPVQGYTPSEPVPSQTQFTENVQPAPIEYFQHLPAASNQYSTYADADDSRNKRDSFNEHPDAYLRPPSADADSPAWQDGNNWDLGYDASDILSPPMPLSLGIPYDTIKYSSEEADVPEVSAASSNRYEASARAPQSKYSRSRPEIEDRPRKPYKRPYKPRHHEDYEDFPPHTSRPHKRPSRRPPPIDYDYEDLPPRSHGKRSPNRHYSSAPYYDYDEPPTPHRHGPSVTSYVKTDKQGHYKWGVRHNH